jgi:glycerol-3-phosphate acyltransferase PlsY
MSPLGDPGLALRLDWPFAALAFLFGSIPWGVIVSRVFFKSDIRASGSGNIGAANALRTLGRKAGIAILLLDALKGVAAVFVCGALLSGAVAGYASAQHVAVVNDAWRLAPIHGLFAVLGHCYTPWLRFQGGKGVATYLGAILSLWWPSGLAFAVTWLAVVIPTRFASAGSILATAVAGLVIIVAGGSVYGSSTWFFAIGSLLVIIWKHRENIARLRAGTESKLTSGGRPKDALTERSA